MRTGGDRFVSEVHPRQPAFAVRAPLMAFATVSRRTGPIRKRCIVQNDSGAPLELVVHHDFAEHSWIQLVAAGGDGGGGGGVGDRHGDGSGGGEPGKRRGGREREALRVPPGESAIDVVIDTDNSNFPSGSFRGAIELRPAATGPLREGAAEARPQRISISFEEILELEDFDGYAAIDLGTNGAVIAVYHRRLDASAGTTWTPDLDRDGASRRLPVDVPAAVLIRDLAAFRDGAPDSAYVGHRALAEYRDRPDCDPHALLLGSKRHLGRRRMLAADLEGNGGHVAPEDAIHQLGRHVRARCQSHPRIRARLPRLTVTYPPTWDQRQLERWKDVFRRLGYRDEDLDLALDEASAVGLFHLHEWTRTADGRDRLLQDLREQRREIRRGDEVGEQFALTMLCFDFGGGTTDLACIEAELELFGDALHIRLALRGSDSLDYGGDQVTLAVFRILKRRIAQALADPERFGGSRSGGGAGGSAGSGGGGGGGGERGGGDGDADRGERAGGDEAACAAWPSEDVAAGARPRPGTTMSASGPTHGLFLLPGSGGGGGRGHADLGDERAAEIVRLGWERIDRGIAEPALDAELEDAIDRLFATRFWPDRDAPLLAAAKRNFAWLWDRAESLKCDLFDAARRRAGSVAFGGEDGADLRMGIPFAQLPDGIGTRAANAAAADAHVAVGVDEIYAAIRAPLREAIERARRLCGSRRPDRIVLAGRSSCIPLVRQSFARPRSEGGLGVAPGKIVFDPEHAKTAVSRGACLLPVLRHALVGVSVDVSRFRVALLRDIWYGSPMGNRRELFRAGPIGELASAEDDPDPATFARYLTIFSGDDRSVLGQFDFEGAGEPLPDWRARAQRSAAGLGLDDFPTPQQLERLGEQDPDLARRATACLDDWSDRERIAWQEAHARRGRDDRPLYRYYLTRSRQLLAVRDTGSGAACFALDYAASDLAALPTDRDPFAGVH